MQIQVHKHHRKQVYYIYGCRHIARSSVRMVFNDTSTLVGLYLRADEDYYDSKESHC